MITQKERFKSMGKRFLRHLQKKFREESDIAQFKKQIKKYSLDNIYSHWMNCSPHLMSMAGLC